MPTRQGDDGIIDIPGDSSRIQFQETSAGARVVAQGTTVDVRGAVASGGTIDASGGTFRESSWTLGNRSNLNFSNTALSNSTVAGNGGRNNLGIGEDSASRSNAKLQSSSAESGALTSRYSVSSPNTRVNGLRTNLYEGRDSISFASGTSTRDSRFRLNTGRDSITFAAGSTTTNTRINLGIDNNADRVEIARLRDMNNVTINRFRSNDTLRIGGRTYDYEDLQQIDGRFGDNLRVNLD